MSVANRLVFRALKPDRAVVLGHEMFLDPNDSLKLSLHGVYEPLATEIVLERLRPGARFVDVGANIGYFTLLAARAVGPNGAVYAFEPEPENHAILKRNVEHAGYRNVTLSGRAVSDRRGTLMLYCSESNRGDHRLYASESDRRAIEVDVVPLDEELADVPAVDFIKMDIQGAEAHALAGMVHLIERSESVDLLTEFWPWGIAKCGGDPGAFVERLLELGFDLEELDEERRRRLPVAKNELLSRYTVENERFTNLYATKRSRHG
jgi:FkbM family methyltransferase